MTTAGHRSTTGNALFWVRDNVMADHFPPVQSALRDPDGLLAIGGDLKPERLLDAYRHGIFPWYSQGQPILWWSPNPRCVLQPESLKISRSLGRTLRIEESGGQVMPKFNEPVMMARAGRGGEASVETPIEPSDIEIRAQVSLTIEIK